MSHSTKTAAIHCDATKAVIFLDDLGQKLTAGQITPGEYRTRTSWMLDNFTRFVTIEYS